MSRLRILYGTLFVMACSADAQRDTTTPLRGPAKPVRATTECTVVRVIDGDTIQCKEQGRVRLIGIDAPEATQAPYYAQSAEALRRMLPPNTHVQIEQDLERQDQFKRVLGYVWLGDRMLNFEMMRAGWTVLLTYPPNTQYVAYFTKAQDLARKEKLGLWSKPAFTCAPIEHRRKKC